jgi:hypothetical protein
MFYIEDIQLFKIIRNYNKLYFLNLIIVRNSIILLFLQIMDLNSIYKIGNKS